MAKGKMKSVDGGNGNGDSSAPPQPRSLRSRKRESPSDDAQTSHHQETEMNIAVDATLHLCQLPSLLQPTVVALPPHQVAEKPFPTNQDPVTEEKHAEPTNLTVKAIEVKEETTVTNPNTYTQHEAFRSPTDNDSRGSEKQKEETSAEDSNRPPAQTCNDPVLVHLPTGKESCAAALGKQLGAENCVCPLEGNEDKVRVPVADVKEVKQEAAAELPVKKKRRMGVCGLTDRERVHFLQILKCEMGQTEPERPEGHICSNTDMEAQEDIISPPSLSNPEGRVTEEIKLQSGHCDHNSEHRASETEVTTSDETSFMCDPGSSCEAEEASLPGPDPTGDNKSEPPAEEEVLEYQEQQECEGSTAGSLAENPQQQMKDVGDASAAGDQSSTVGFSCNAVQHEEAENQDVMEDVMEDAPLQVNSVTKTRDEKTEELTCDAGDDASPTDTQSGRFNCDAELLCGTVVTPGGSQRKHSCDPDEAPAAGPSVKIPRTRDTADLVGSGYLDYVSDSQLNTIELTEEGVIEWDKDLCTDDCEDATDLIRGLIEELSSLNRKAMATHRELESLRRSSRGSRSSTR